MKAHGVFQKLVVGAGSWEAARVMSLKNAPVGAISACMERMAEYMAHLRRLKPISFEALGMLQDVTGCNIRKACCAGTDAKCAGASAACMGGHGAVCAGSR